MAVVGAVILASAVSFGQQPETVVNLLSAHQEDLAGAGRGFLIREAAGAMFLAIGGLHGDNETPALVQELAAALGPAGYRHAAVEMSPWAARRLSVALGDPSGERIWGADIEELQSPVMIRELADANPSSASLQLAAEMTRSGYRRELAPQLLPILNDAAPTQRDIEVQHISLRQLILRTLAIEAARLDRDATLRASMDREQFMKELFIAQYRRAAREEAAPRVILAFGQNHLHRGYDSRGVATLGNFVAELAAAKGGRSFHVALFAAGGQLALAGLRDADQRGDEPAFALLASVARFPATVFDTHPLRQALHSQLVSSRDPELTNLRYWADSYDAIICYRSVTPSADPRSAR